MHAVGLCMSNAPCSSPITFTLSCCCIVALLMVLLPSAPMHLLFCDPSEWVLSPP
jgi:hypothetical protein